MSDEESDRHKAEYAQLLALFINFLKNIHSDSREDVEYALMELRAELAINHAFDGFHIDEEEALQLLRNQDERYLSESDIEKKKRVIAAVDNLIAFAVCEEYHVIKQTNEIYKRKLRLNKDYQIDFNDPDDVGDYESVNELYNDQYASVENADIEYAMGIALWWLGIGSNDLITYWTMNDAKVRPWHMALQGYTAPRDEFPSWMIPPIEWNCRCFLISAGKADEVWDFVSFKKVVGKLPKKPKQIDNTFSESVAKCGRIFGPSHNYFKVDRKDKKYLQSCMDKIRRKYYGN